METRGKTLAEFETYDLLAATDDLDIIRGILADGPYLQPPEIRNDLLKLHGLAMQASGQRNADSQVFELADDLLLGRRNPQCVRSDCQGAESIDHYCGS